VILLDVINVGIPLLLLFIFLVFKMPVGFALGFSGSIGLYLVGGSQSLMGTLQITPFRTAAHYLLTTIPLFILMAEFASNSSLREQIFDGAKAWVGRLPGGLAISTVLASAGIGAISGSSSATAALMARSAVPEMERLGYERKLSLGTVASAGTLAILIPPSTILIMYGVITEESIGKLLIAGIIPGILQALIFMAIIVIVVLRKPHLAPKTEEITWGDRFSSLKNLWSLVIVATIIFGGIYTGAMTVVEAAGIGAFLTLIISLFKGLNWEGFKKSLNNTIYTTSMIFTIIIGAMIFGYFLTISRVTQNLIGYVASLDVSKYVILSIILLILLILGFFMDQLAIMVLTLPLIYPLIHSLGFDLIWFGIVSTIMVEIGMLTPPLGLNAFVTSNSANAKIEEVFAGVWRFVGASLVLVVIIIIFPGIVTWLPSLMK
jgi:C4-dicarboxylate transporter, DctM subunit